MKAPEMDFSFNVEPQLVEKMVAKTARNIACGVAIYSEIGHNGLQTKTASADGEITCFDLIHQ
jgi:hypothetical protein